MIIGHVGRFMKQKNHKYLIDIFAEFNRRVPDSYLLLLGTGELEDEIHHYVNERGLSDRVIFTGSVANVEDFYSAMDVFVLPSLYEGFPVVSVEAQAADLPILISDNVDPSCDITNNVNFIPVNLRFTIWVNEIINLSTQKRNTLILDVLKTKNYDIHNESKKLESIYKNVD